LVRVQPGTFMIMKKEHKEILRELVQRELGELEKIEEDIEFPSGNFIKSREVYEQVLKDVLKELK